MNNFLIGKIFLELLAYNTLRGLLCIYIILRFHCIKIKDNTI